jgi:hypothetical protein
LTVATGNFNVISGTTHVGSLEASSLITATNGLTIGSGNLTVSSGSTSVTSLSASGLITANGLTVENLRIRPPGTNTSAEIKSGTNTYTLPSNSGTIALLSDVVSQINSHLPQYNQLTPTNSTPVQVTSAGYYFVTAESSLATVVLNPIPIGGVLQFMEVSTTGYTLSYNNSQTFSVPNSSSVVGVSIIDPEQTGGTKFVLFCNGIQL